MCDNKLSDEDKQILRKEYLKCGTFKLYGNNMMYPLLFPYNKCCIRVDGKTKKMKFDNNITDWPKQIFYYQIPVMLNDNMYLKYLNNKYTISHICGQPPVFNKSKKKKYSQNTLCIQPSHLQITNINDNIQRKKCHREIKDWITKYRNKLESGYKGPVFCSKCCHTPKCFINLGFIKRVSGKEMINWKFD